MTQIIRIAIIDDDESVRQALGSLVRSLGHETRLFESADAFLDSGAIAESALLITDVQMPGTNGIELQEHLRALGYPVPLVFITAYPEDALRKRAYAGGASCFLGKPFDGDTIIRCIQAALSEGAPPCARLG